MDIFILCTANEGGRYVNNATTDPDKARRQHEQLLRGFVLDGWHIVKTAARERLNNDDGAALELSSVVYLRNDAEQWLNIEEYHVHENNTNNNTEQ